MKSENFFYKLPIIQTISFFIFLFTYSLVFFILDCNKKTNTFINFIQTENFEIQSQNDIDVLVSKYSKYNSNQNPSVFFALITIIGILIICLISFIIAKKIYKNKKNGVKKNEIK